MKYINKHSTIDEDKIYVALFDEYKPAINCAGYVHMKEGDGFKEYKLYKDYATLALMPYPNHSLQAHTAEILAYVVRGHQVNVYEFNDRYEMYSYLKKYRMAKELQR